MVYAKAMIKPAERRIIIKPIEKQQESKIMLSKQDMMEHTLDYGEVVFGSEKYPTGMKVYYSTYSTARVNDHGQELYIIPEIDVMAYDA